VPVGDGVPLALRLGIWASYRVLAAQVDAHYSCAIFLPAPSIPVARLGPRSIEDYYCQ
jgi:hypothetical protein